MNSPRYFYLHDRLGSVREIINSSGTVENCYYYTPWGGITGSETDENVSNWFGWAGYLRDEEIGSYYCNARQYNSARFTTRDPVQGSRKAPATLHAYLYCLNDPINRTDPTGEMSLPEHTATIANTATLASNSYDNVMRFKQYAKLITSGASIQSALLSVAIDVGMDYMGGKVFDMLSGFGSRIAHNLKFKYASRGLEWHHFATNKHSKYTPKFEELLDKFKLGLDDDWNKLLMPQKGRHPHAYHDWVLGTMKEAAAEAGGDVNKFLAIFDCDIIGGVLLDPDKLRKAAW